MSIIEPLSPRQNDILDLARVSGRVNVDDLAERFAVSPQTIRKDLNDLCDRHLLSRIHGGAILGSGVENVGYDARRSIAAPEKRLIGLAAAKLIPAGASLFMNIGTTVEEVARALLDHEDLLVITNNLHVALLLHHHPKIEVIVAGGAVRRQDAAVVGSAAIDFINQFKVDVAIIGASAIDEDGTLLDYDYREVRVARAIIERARRIVLVADKIKLARSAPVRIAHLSEMDVFVTDELPSPRLVDLCRAHEVEVIQVLAEPPPAAG